MNSFDAPNPSYMAVAWYTTDVLGI